MRAHLLNGLLRASRTPLRTRTRALHAMVPLRFDVEKGLGDFLPPDALQMVAVDLQEGLLDRLNHLVRDTVYENKSLVDTVILAARSGKDIAIFNTASQAMNNAFFLDNLREPVEDGQELDVVKYQYHAAFHSTVVRDFGSFENMKSVVSATAMGMSGSGWVWLCENLKGSLAAVPTFASGTMIVKDRMQNGGNIFHGANNRLPAGDPLAKLPPSPAVPTGAAWSSPVSGTLHPPSPRNPPHTRSLHPSPAAAQVNPYGPAVGGSYGHYSRGVNTHLTDSGSVETSEQAAVKGDDYLNPLFCISVHEHMWLSAGLGIWGKEEYLRRFWSALDWSYILRYHVPKSSSHLNAPQYA